MSNYQNFTTSSLNSGNSQASVEDDIIRHASELKRLLGSFDNTRSSSSVIFPLISVKFFHSGYFRVFETMYLEMLFILSAKPASSVMGGQAVAKPSYVFLPSKRALLLNSSWNLYIAVSSFQNSKLQPPRSDFSDTP